MYVFIETLQISYSYYPLSTLKRIKIKSGHLTLRITPVLKKEDEPLE